MAVQSEIHAYPPIVRLRECYILDIVLIAALQLGC
jgi:hypothetical protein